MNVFEYFEDDVNLYIVTELCRGGELFDRIMKKKHLSEAEASRVMEQILAAIAFCHKKGIVHRDLKPENAIFLSDDPQSILKVIDFGTSIEAGTRKLSQVIGTVTKTKKVKNFKIQKVSTKNDANS